MVTANDMSLNVSSMYIGRFWCLFIKILQLPISLIATASANNQPAFIIIVIVLDDAHHLSIMTQCVSL